MKKIVFVIAAMLVSLASHAQFEAGKAYVGASLSGIDLSYNGLTKGHMNLQGKVGYLFADNVMGTAQLAYDKQEDMPYAMTVGAGGRYYIEQNGLYLGASANYVNSPIRKDFVPSAQCGYAFFLNRTVTIEPEVYYNLSTKDVTEYSGFGIRLGLGIYFE